MQPESQNSNVNIRMIAKKAGVSIASVSIVLSGKQLNRVSSEVRERILKVCEKLKYYPNIHTVRMLKRRADTIAVIIPEDSISYADYRSGTIDSNLGSVILGIEDILSKNTQYLTLMLADKDFIKKREYIKMYRGKFVDGFIIWGLTNRDKYVYELVEEGAPIVTVHSKVNDADIPYVIPDDKSGMEQVTRYVLKMRHRKIAVATPALTSYAGNERLQGVLNVLKRYRCKPYITDTQGYGFENGIQAAKEIFTNTKDITCIIGPNDRSALGIIHYAREHGIKVPDDLSVTGADNIELWNLISLTTYKLPSFELGREAMKLLNKQIKNGLPKQKIKTPHKIIPVEFKKGETVKKLSEKKKCI